MEIPENETKTLVAVHFFSVKKTPPKIRMKVLQRKKSLLCVHVPTQQGCRYSIHCPKGSGEIVQDCKQRICEGSDRYWGRYTPKGFGDRPHGWIYIKKHASSRSYRLEEALSSRSKHGFSTDGKQSTMFKHVYPAHDFLMFVGVSLSLCICEWFSLLSWVCRNYWSF